MSNYKDGINYGGLKTDHPDPTKHKIISFIKSGFRIAAGVALACGYLQGAGGLLVLAEILGIVEELV